MHVTINLPGGVATLWANEDGIRASFYDGVQTWEAITPDEILEGISLLNESPAETSIMRWLR